MVIGFPNDHGLLKPWSWNQDIPVIIDLKGCFVTYMLPTILLNCIQTNNLYTINGVQKVFDFDMGVGFLGKVHHALMTDDEFDECWIYIRGSQH